MWKLSYITENELLEVVGKTIFAMKKQWGILLKEAFERNSEHSMSAIYNIPCYQKFLNLPASSEKNKSEVLTILRADSVFHNELLSKSRLFNATQVLKNDDWDIVMENKKGLTIGNDLERVSRIYVKIKNTPKTTDPDQILDTYITMQNKLLYDKECACFLVEAIAQHSQNIKWETTVDKKKVGHKFIRRVSIDQFYTLVTGQEDAFYQLCMVLPEVIQKTVDSATHISVPEDTVMEELREIAKNHGTDEDTAVAMAVYMLGFGGYRGF